jgi:hypothetical protein
MVVPSHQVVNPPSEHQGSVLGRIVAGDSVLGQLLYWIVFSLALKRSISETQAELAALRATCLHKLSEFTYIPSPIDREDEPPFFQRLIVAPLSQHPHHFPTMVYVSVGVKNGNDVKQKCIVRVVDGVEDSTGYVWQNQTKVNCDESLKVWIENEKLKPSEKRFQQVTPEDVDWGLRQGIRNWNIDGRSKNHCPLCDELLKEGRYICPSHSKKYWEVLKTRQAPDNRPQVKPINRSTPEYIPSTEEVKLWILCESLAPYMPVNLFDIACSVPYKTAWKHLTAFKRWLTESKMVAERHPNAPPKVRPLERILSECRYFPI